MVPAIGKNEYSEYNGLRVFCVVPKNKHACFLVVGTSWSNIIVKQNLFPNGCDTYDVTSET